MTANPHGFYVTANAGEGGNLCFVDPTKGPVKIPFTAAEARCFARLLNRAADIVEGIRPEDKGPDPIAYRLDRIHFPEGEPRTQRRRRRS